MMNAKYPDNKERWITRLSSVVLGLMMLISIVVIVLNPKIQNDIVIDSWAEISIIGMLVILYFATAGTLFYVGINGRVSIWLRRSLENENSKRAEVSRVRRLVSATVLYSPFFIGALGVNIVWPLLENTINIDKLLNVSLLIGLLSGILLKPFETVLHIKEGERWAARVMFSLGIIASSAAAIGYSNFRYSTHSCELVDALVLAKNHSGNRNEWRLLIELYGRKNWVLVNAKAWRSADEGEVTQLSIQEGYWGLPVVRFNVVTP